MKKNLQTFIMGSLTLFSIHLYSLSNISIPPEIEIKEALPINSESEETFALNYLNRLRIGAGLIPFSPSKTLNKASSSHASYLIENHTYGHKEDKNLSGYTGLYASNRIGKAGYPTHLVIENVSNNNRNAKESIDGLMAAIYHRFAFLSFNADEIGIGIQQNSIHREETSFVYNISLKALKNLCIKKTSIESYKSYSDVCVDKSIKVSTQKLNETFNISCQKNSSLILYPFEEQYDVPPAFFNELPDPLPDYKVSGFPISLSFNPAFFRKIKLLNFEIFDKNGNKIKEIRKYDYKSDPHQRLKKGEFVLFPLQRLDWDSSYSVKFIALVQEKKIEKEWAFHTRSFKEAFYKVSEKNKRYRIKKDEPTVFYFPPRSPSELLRNLKYTADYDIEFIDQNTIKLTAFKNKGYDELILGEYKLKLDIHN